MHFARLATLTVLKDEESERDNHVLACNFARYLKKLTGRLRPFLIWLLTTPSHLQGAVGFLISI